MSFALTGRLCRNAPDCGHLSCRDEKFARLVWWRSWAAKQPLRKVIGATCNRLQREWREHSMTALRRAVPALDKVRREIDQFVEALSKVKIVPPDVRISDDCQTCGGCGVAPDLKDLDAGLACPTCGGEGKRTDGTFTAIIRVSPPAPYITFVLEPIPVDEVRACVGCSHPHADGRSKPCPCGCEGFVRSFAAYAQSGCENPDCVECRETGRHP